MCAGPALNNGGASSARASIKKTGVVEREEACFITILGSRKLYVIMDNLPVHKGKLVTAWIAANADRIKVFYLPPYAPDVNPDEYLNNDLKQNVHRKSGLPQSKRVTSNHLCQFIDALQGLGKVFEAPPRLPWAAPAEPTPLPPSLVSGGTLNREYTLENRITTVGGRKYSRKLIIFIQPKSGV